LKEDQIQMNNKSIFEGMIVATLLAFALILSGCATSTASDAPAVESSAEAAKAAEPAEPIEPWDGDGMDIPVDGSSLEAFDRYMARVKAHTDPAHYTTLVNAFDYLLVYDLGAKRDKATLVSRLDGLTGHQVVNKVSWQKK